MPTRRGFYRFLSMLGGNTVAIAMAVPGVRFLLDPLTKKGQERNLLSLARLSQLQPGKPQAFSIIEEKQDAWVKYPKEPVGSVWLVRQPDGAKEKVLAFSAECPHLSCSVTLSNDRQGFQCPCHGAMFGLDGAKKNAVSPRGMDGLEVDLSDDPDPVISVRFARFQPQSAEKKSLA